MDAGAGGFERRIGRRRAVDVDVVQWEETRDESDPAIDVLPPPQHGKAILDNISVSGAGLVVPTWTNLSIGTKLLLELGGTWGPVEIVRVHPTTEPSLIYCGVTFQTKDPGFHAAVADLVGGRPPPASRYWD